MDGTDTSGQDTYCSLPVTRRYHRIATIRVASDSPDGSKWTAHIRGQEDNTDRGVVSLRLTESAIVALMECVQAETECGEGRLNVNRLLSSLHSPASNAPIVSLGADDPHFDYEGEDSSWTTSWYFGDITIMRDASVVMTGVDIKRPPSPSEIPSALWRGVEALWERDANELWREVNDNDGWTVREDFTFVDVGPDGIDEVRNALARPACEGTLELLWPIIVEVYVSFGSESEQFQSLIRDEGRTDAANTASLERLLLQLAARQIRGIAQAAMEHLDGRDVLILAPSEQSGIHFFNPEKMGLSDESLESDLELLGLKWWPVEHFIDHFLNPASDSCRKDVRPWIGFDDTFTLHVGVRSSLPFVGSHRGRRLSSQLGFIDTMECGLNAFRCMDFDSGEFDSGIPPLFSNGGDPDELGTYPKLFRMPSKSPFISLLGFGSPT